MRSLRLLPLTLSALALFLGACSKKQEAPKVEENAASALRVSSVDEKLIAQKFPEAQSSPTGLKWIVRKPGTGTTTPKYGSSVVVEYDLRLLDGTNLESSIKSGSPISFHVGLGRVIKGWDEALLDMKKGEKRTLIIPHWLGYGTVGSPPKIPSYATLVFEVELVDVR
jgi:FKBP-type peptidyl-prolyl cis-trans isomerase